MTISIDDYEKLSEYIHILKMISLQVEKKEATKS